MVQVALQAAVGWCFVLASICGPKSKDKLHQSPVLSITSGHIYPIKDFVVDGQQHAQIVYIYTSCLDARLFHLQLLSEFGPMSS
jgi:hypothetical protein